MSTAPKTQQEASPESGRAAVGAESNDDRRGGVADRRARLVDRRDRAPDRRGELGDRRRTAEVRYRATTDTTLQAQLAAWQERERFRIAADLHDSIGSSLCTIRLKLQEEVGQLPRETPQAASLAAIVTDVARAMDEVRRIAMDLRPAILDDLGVLATINWLSREIEGCGSNLRVERRIDVRETDIPAPRKTAIFRILQESLGNALKHARARRVRIDLRWEAGELRLQVEDDGAGFDLSRVLRAQDPGPHFGIANMRLRASSSGGVLAIRSAPGEGTVVSCAWPDAGR